MVKLSEHASRAAQSSTRFSRRLPEGLLSTYAAMVSTLVLNLFGGVLVARLLGAGGRGELAFQVQASAVAVALCSAGLSQSVTVLSSRGGGALPPWLVPLQK